MNGWTSTKTETRSFRDGVLPAVWIPWGNKEALSYPEFAPTDSLWPVEASGFARSKMVAAIDSARYVVCVCSFLFSDVLIRDALLRAAARGVRCYLLTMSEQHLLKDSSRETEWGQRQIEEHKATLDALSGRVLVRTAPHFHSKFLVVDPGDPARIRGFISTANLTQEGLTRNPELVVAVEGGRAKALFGQFRAGFWSEGEHELLEPGRLEVLGQAGRRAVTPPWSADLPVTARGYGGLKDALLEIVRWTRDEIWLSSYNISEEHEVTQALLTRIRAGLKAHVFVSARAVNMPAAMTLARAGAEVRSRPFLHAKAVLGRTGEDFRGLVMTANVESRGLDEGFETGVVLSRQECQTLRRVLSEWSGFGRLSLDVKRGEIEGLCYRWNGRELEEAMVGGALVMELGEVPAESLPGLAETRPPAFSEPEQTRPVRLPHEITYRWTVVPPTLPRGAQRVRADGPYPLYRLRGTTYLVVPSPDKLEDAMRVAADVKARLVAEGPAAALPRDGDGQDLRQDAEVPGH